MARGKPKPNGNAPVAVAPVTVATFRDLIARMAPQMEAAIPMTKKKDVERLARLAVNAIQNTPKLLQCTQHSVMSSIMKAVQLGLEPDGLLGHAYIIPFGTQAQLLIGYKGLMELCRRSGQIRSITAQVVYEKDRFDVVQGTAPGVIHEPAWQLEDRGPLVAAYAVAWLTTDGPPMFRVLSKVEIEDRRKRSASVKAGRSSPWDTDYAAMACKSAVRALATYLPLSVEVQKAVAVDEEQELGLKDVTPSTTFSTPGPAQDLDELTQAMGTGPTGGAPEMEKPDPETEADTCAVLREGITTMIEVNGVDKIVWDAVCKKAGLLESDESALESASGGQLERIAQLLRDAVGGGDA
jgi:recombination protein RecT